MHIILVDTYPYLVFIQTKIIPAWNRVSVIPAFTLAGCVPTDTLAFATHFESPVTCNNIIVYSTIIKFWIWINTKVTSLTNIPLCNAFIVANPFIRIKAQIPITCIKTWFQTFFYFRALLQKLCLSFVQVVQKGSLK